MVSPEPPVWWPRNPLIGNGVTGPAGGVPGTPSTTPTAQYGSPIPQPELRPAGSRDAVRNSRRGSGDTRFPKSRIRYGVPGTPKSRIRYGVPGTQVWCPRNPKSRIRYGVPGTPVLLCRGHAHLDARRRQIYRGFPCRRPRSFAGRERTGRPSSCEASVKPHPELHADSRPSHRRPCDSHHGRAPVWVVGQGWMAAQQIQVGVPLLGADDQFQ